MEWKPYRLPQEEDLSKKISDATGSSVERHEERKLESKKNTRETTKQEKSTNEFRQK